MHKIQYSLLGLSMVLSPFVAHSFALPDTLCTSCLTTLGSGPSLGKLFSDFDSIPFLQSKIGTNWFCFNDAEGRFDVQSRSDFSDITKGALNDTIDLSSPPELQIHGNGKTGNGAAIDFTIGKPFYEISALTKTKPFLGLGVRLSNDGGMTYDLEKDSSTGIYFEYKLSGSGIQQVRFEARAYQQTWGTYFDTHRIWWNLPVPETGGVWKAAKILWTNLVLPQEAKDKIDSADRPLNKKEMMFFSWSVSGDSGMKGSLSLDNVYLVGAKKITPLPIKGSSQKRPFSMGGNLQVRLSGKFLLLSVSSRNTILSISLLNIHGATVLQAAINSDHSELNIASLTKGICFVVVKWKGLNGKLMSYSRPIGLF